MSSAFQFSLFSNVSLILLIIKPNDNIEIFETFGDMVILDVTYAVQRVGRFLIQHKFFERDQRLRREDLVHEEPYFMLKFPQPPLEIFPVIVTSECRRGFLACLKRTDELIKYNFTRKDLFMVRTAASYYMCWYTMLLEPLLSKFHTTCHIPYDEPELVKDYRGFDKHVFDCAHHSFCPDPCCGKISRLSSQAKTFVKHENRTFVKGTARYKSECTTLPDYHCGFAGGGCKFDSKRNRNFKDLISNKFNLTCSCLHHKKGFVYNNRFRMCIDYDECKYKNYFCEPLSVCRNVESDYYCTCSIGHKFNHVKQKCVRDENFEFVEVLKDGGGGGIVVKGDKKVMMEEFFLIAWLRWMIKSVLLLMDSETYRQMSL